MRNLTSKHMIRAMTRLMAIIAVAALTAHCRTGDARSGLPAQTGGVISGSVDIPGAASGKPGRLVVWWERSDERTDGHLDWDLFSELMTRFVVVETGDLGGRTVPFRLENVPAGQIRVHSIVDIGGVFWPTLLGAGEGNWKGEAQCQVARDHTTSIRVPLNSVGVQKSTEYCTGERFKLLTVNDPQVVGTLGNSADRRLCVRLPETYANAPTSRYPVIYLLPGLGSTDRSRMTGDNSLVEVADELAADVILVGVDTSTRSGSTYFANSPMSGQWASFIDRMIAAVDQEFRTIPRPAARGLIGQSTGGFNAVSLGFRRPDLFGLIGASAPDGLDLGAWLLDGDDCARGGCRLRKRWLDWMRFEAAIAQPDARQSGQFISYAVDWSPSEPLQWPADLTTGALNWKVWKQWHQHSPIAFLEDPKSAAAIKATFNDRIIIATGVHDEFDLHEPSVAFSNRLTQAGIEHTFVSGQGAHGKGQNRRLRIAFEYMLARL